MKVVIQRVAQASVMVEYEIIGQIDQGLCVFVGFAQQEQSPDLDRLIHKIVKMRVFADDKVPMNRSLLDVGGGLLLVSQFTLYANCAKGNRPSFSDSMGYEQAQQLFDQLIDRCRQLYPDLEVQTGVFGADMQVAIINDGPVTIVL